MGQSIAGITARESTMKSWKKRQSRYQNPWFGNRTWRCVAIKAGWDATDKLLLSLIKIGTAIFMRSGMVFARAPIFSRRCANSVSRSGRQRKKPGDSDGVG